MFYCFCAPHVDVLNSCDQRIIGIHWAPRNNVSKNCDLSTEELLATIEHVPHNDDSKGCKIVENYYILLYLIMQYIINYFPTIIKKIERECMTKFDKIQYREDYTFF